MFVDLRAWKSLGEAGQAGARRLGYGAWGLGLLHPRYLPQRRAILSPRLADLSPLLTSPRHHRFGLIAVQVPKLSLPLSDTTILR